MAAAGTPRCCTVDGVVAFIGVVSAVIHVLEFFAFWYLLAAFFILTGDAHRPDDHFWGLLYPALLVLHSVLQAALSLLLAAGALKRRKAYILPWIVPASAWITATTVAFSSVQLFYVSCVVLYFRRLKKMEREIQPPEVYKCS
ncbi:hypothetical protein MTO96_001756 [Rhipicephalus appendiculatus]